MSYEREMKEAAKRLDNLGDLASMIGGSERADEEERGARFRMPYSDAPSRDQGRWKTATAK